VSINEVPAIINAFGIPRYYIYRRDLDDDINAYEIDDERYYYPYDPVPSHGTSGGFITLIDSSLTGGLAENVAVINTGHLHLRNVSISGYGVAIEEHIGGNLTSLPYEYFSEQPLSLFPGAPNASLGLPIEETPTYWDPDFSNWANVQSFKQAGDPDDTASIQRAIDSGN